MYLYVCIYVKQSPFVQDKSPYRTNQSINQSNKQSITFWLLSPLVGVVEFLLNHYTLISLQCPLKGCCHLWNLPYWISRITLMPLLLVRPNSYFGRLVIRWLKFRTGPTGWKVRGGLGFFFPCHLTDKGEVKTSRGNLVTFSLRSGFSADFWGWEGVNSEWMNPKAMSGKGKPIENRIWKVIGQTSGPSDSKETSAAWNDGTAECFLLVQGATYDCRVVNDDLPWCLTRARASQ